MRIEFTYRRHAAYFAEHSRFRARRTATWLVFWGGLLALAGAAMVVWFHSTVPDAIPGLAFLVFGAVFLRLSHWRLHRVPVRPDSFFTSRRWVLTEAQEAELRAFLTARGLLAAGAGA